MRSFPCKMMFAVLLMLTFSATESAEHTSPLEQAANDLRADYRQQQWSRLEHESNRDDLIAAVLVGMADGSTPAIAGHASAERRLAEMYGHDPLALFVLALSCQVQTRCAHSEYYDALVRVAPDNAVHWLLLPNMAAPSAAQLRAAATASVADSHLRTTIAIVRSALANQRAPKAVPGVDARELVQQLRRTIVDLVPVAVFGKTVAMCKVPAPTLRSDCIALGRLLFHDRSGSILVRMVGSAMLRRLVRGSPEDTAAKELRRDYVWGSERLSASHAAYAEQLQSEIAEFGEWEAWQRNLDRLGISRKPPPGWAPKDPNLLLLSEERSPAPAK